MTRWRIKLFILSLIAVMAGWTGMESGRPVRPTEAVDKAPDGVPKSTPRAPQVLPAGRGSSSPLPATRILDERRLPANAPGVFSRLRLVETKSHLRVRVAETWKRGAAGSNDQMTERTEMVADRLMVKMREGQTLQALTAWAKGLRLEILRSLPHSPFVLLKLPDADVQRFDQWLAQLNQKGLPIEYAEPDLIRHAFGAPDDLRFAEQWALQNTGQTGGKPGADVGAPAAWDISTGSTSVVVAVLDTGIDLTHPDLAPNLWVNTGEIAGNNKDDDGDGYMDDVNGWNFVSGNNNVADDNDHGSHCAGIIGAVGNNHLGVSGICPVVRIMPVKVIDAEGYATVSGIVAGMDYAIARGATIMSSSYGGSGSSLAEKTAIIAAMNAGVLMVTAAGNDYPGANVDVHPSYPGSYPCNNIINVAATGQNDTLATFSNYGPASVDLAAPGVGILSTVRGGNYAYFNGTSMSCPLVAGACALLKASQPGLSWTAVKSAILNAADPLPALAGKVKTGGRLNVARALRIGAGPCIELTKTVVADGKALGAKGNADGIINPGEDITVAVTIKNTGPAAASAVTTTATITTGSAAVTVLKGSRVWGNLAAGTAATNAAAPFVLQIAAGAASQAFTLHLAHRDNAGHSWNSDANFTIAGTQSLTGLVTYLASGQPVNKATVSYTGPVSGKVLTGSTGRYTLKIPDGTYSVSASLAGYEPAAAQTVSVPSTPSTADFQLGRGQLVVSPASLSSTLVEGQTDHQAVTLKNTGTLPLSVTLSSSQLGVTINAATANFVPWWDRDTPAMGQTDAATTAALPYEHGFETITLSGWSAAKYYGYWFGHYAIQTSGAASGSRCLHQWGIGEPAGLAHGFPANTMPRYVSAWVKPGATTGRLAAVALEAASSDDNGTLIFVPVATVLAVEDGLFHAGNAARPPTSAHYNANQWQHVEIKNINWMAHVYDVYINGTLADAGVPFESYANAAARIRLYNEGEGDAWWDDIKVGGNETDWLQPQSAPLTIEPGATATADVIFDAGALHPGTALGQLHVRSNDPVKPLVTLPVTLKVLANTLNTPAYAVDGQVTVLEDVPTLLTLPTLNTDGDPLLSTLQKLPAKGTLYQTVDGMTMGDAITTVPAVLANTTGKVFYLAPENQYGQQFDSVTFTAQDWRHATGATGLLTINVQPVNDPPVAVDDAFAELTDGSYGPLGVLNNDYDVDGDTLNVAAITQGTRGTVSINPDGHSLSYQPNSDFVVGRDVFTYTASDGHGGLSIATVTISRGGNPSEDWPSEHHDSQRSNFSLSSTNGLQFQEQWETPSVYGTTNFAPVVAGGVVVRNSNDYFTGGNHLTAYDLASGGVIWEFRQPQIASISSPLIYQEKVIFTAREGSYGSNDRGTVYALNLRTGAVVWTLPYQPFISSVFNPVADAEGVHLVLPTSPSRAVVLNPADGSIIRERNLYPSSSYSYDYDSDWEVILTGGMECFSNAGNLQAFLPDGSTQPLLTYAARDSAVNYAGTKDRIVGFDSGWNLFGLWPAPLHPPLQWQQTLSSNGFSSKFGYGNDACVALGTIYAVSSGAVNAYASLTGQFLRSYALPDGKGAASVIGNLDSLFVREQNQGAIFVFDIHTGQLRQTITDSGMMALAGNSLVTLNENSTILRRYTLVRPNQTVPVATSQTVELNEDATAVIIPDGTASPGPVVGRLITSLPTHGSLYQTIDGTTRAQAITEVPAGVVNADGKVLFVPAADEYGDPYATFNFKVSDSQLLSSEATVTIRVISQPDAPLAVPDHFYTGPGVPITSFWPTINDVNPDGGVLQITSFTQPDHGQVTQNPDGSLSYVPLADAAVGNVESFVYTTANFEGLSSSSTVQLEIIDPKRQDWLPDGTPQLTRQYKGALGKSLVKRWSWQVSNYKLSLPSVACGEGQVFAVLHNNATNGDNRLLAFDGTTGAVNWQTPSGLNYTVSDCNVWNGHLVFFNKPITNTDGFLHLSSYDTATGAFQWSSSLGMYSTYLGGPWLSDAGVFAQQTGSKLARFDPSTGSHSPAFGPGSSFGTIALDGTRAFTQANFAVECWDTGTGARLWSQMLPANDFGSGYASAPAIEDNRVYVTLNRPASLFCLDASTGNILWQVPVDSPYAAYPAGGVVYVATSMGKVKSYSAVTGQWMGDFVYSSLAYQTLTTPIAVTDDLLIVNGGVNTKVFDLHSRALVQSLPGAGFVMDGKVFVNNVTSIDCYGAPSPASNHVPVAASSTLTVNEEASAPVQLTAVDADGQTLKFVVQSLPPLGTLYQTSDGVTKGQPITLLPAMVQDPAGRLIYEAPMDIVGTQTDVFTFAAHDGIDFSTTATVSVTVLPVNDPPQAINDVAVLPPGVTFVDLNPQLNDRDTDGELLAITSYTQPTNGHVTTNADGSLRYTSNAGVTSGTDSFNYTVRDAGGLQSSASVQVLIGSRRALDWTTTGGGNDRSGYMPVELGSGALAPAWTAVIGTVPLRQIAVGNGRVFAQQRGYYSKNALVTLNASSGAELWRQTVGNDGYASPPAWGGGNVLVVDGEGKLWSFADDTGVTKWSVNCAVNNNWTAFAPLADTSGIYVAGQDASDYYYTNLLGFSPFSGWQEFASHSFVTSIQWQPAISQGALYSMADGTFRRHWVGDGSTLWSLVVPSDSGSSEGGFVACDTSAAYVMGLYPTSVTRIDLTTHQVTWQIKASFYGTPTLAHSAVYLFAAAEQGIGNHVPGNRIAVFDAATGVSIWGYDLPPNLVFQDQPVVTNDKVIASSSSLTLVFDLQSHTLLQTLPYGSNASVAGTQLFLADPAGSVHAYSVPGASPAAAGPAPTPVVRQSSSIAATASAVVDSDHHGQSDAFAMAAGTNPLDPKDVFRVCGCKRLADGRHMRVSWPGKAARSYVVEYSTDLRTWNDVSPALGGTGTVMDYDVPVDGRSNCFIRVRVEAVVTK